MLADIKRAPYRWKTATSSATVTYKKLSYRRETARQLPTWREDYGRIRNLRCCCASTLLRYAHFACKNF